jgi:hypothetical protein
MTGSSCGQVLVAQLASTEAYLPCLKNITFVNRVDTKFRDTNYTEMSSNLKKFAILTQNSLNFVSQSFETSLVAKIDVHE